MKEKQLKQILEKINRKGWNIYHTTDVSRSEDIKNNLVEDGLEYNKHYTLLPIADNPKDERSVMDVLENLAIKLNRKMPTIEIHGSRHPFTGFHLRAEDVRLHTEQTTFALYDEFVGALDTIIDTNTGRKKMKDKEND